MKAGDSVEIYWTPLPLLAYRPIFLLVVVVMLHIAGEFRADIERQIPGLGGLRD